MSDEELGEDSSDEQVLMMDEENELYGYGIMNVHQNCLVNLSMYGLSGSGYFENDEVINSKEKIEELFAEFVADKEPESMSDLSHFRIVQVRLDNEMDNECYKIGDDL